jgi:hypothetical protein
MKRITLGFGLVSVAHLDLIISDVCSVLGNGSNDNAHLAMKEVCAQETLLGSYPDRSVYGEGAGTHQFDNAGFDDVKDRVREKDRQLIIDHYRIDVKRVQLRELDFNPLLSAIFMRLKYLKVPEAIPVSLLGRGMYWKKYYNSNHPNAKGVASEYVKNANRLIYEVS